MYFHTRTDHIFTCFHKASLFGVSTSPTPFQDGR
nr:MAG TPA: hypothetical protein [Bacteriophage sp.]DAZ76719.1 MAG TPA: hypothetical protein [Caudoviricetes sp.]